MSVARGKATDFSCVTTKNMTMKGANFLEKLLDNQPVEWKKLGEVCNRTKGTKITAGKMKELHKEAAPIKIFAGGKTVAFVDYGDIPAKDVYTEASVIVKSRGIIEVEYYDAPFSHKAEMWSYASKSSELNIKYLYYYLKTQEFHLQKIASKMQMPQIGISDTESLEIPIPPLSVQSRIVEILDKFTALEAELEEQLQAELELRKKQYAYYREQLLNFSYTPPSEFNVVYKKLGEVCKVQRGASPRPITKYLTDDKLNGIPWIKIGDTKVGEKYIEDTQERITQEGARKSRLLQKGDFVLSNSMSYGRPYILGISGCIHDGWASLSEISNSVLPDYLYYYLSSNEVQHYWTGKINSGSVSNLNSEIIKQLPIPIPPLSEQARIVEILDKFDTLTNSISEGLPLEIQLRRQQYEYYREQLLAFPHP